ncbi:MAG: hypothetical protein FD167_5271, partial [bacterium]
MLQGNFMPFLGSDTSYKTQVASIDSQSKSSQPIFKNTVYQANKQGAWWRKPINKQQLKTDNSRDNLLTDFGMATLRDRYLLENENYQDMF